MHIETVFLKGYRNYRDAVVNLNISTLIIGANDAGKTNLINAIRLLLDKSISELDLEPKSNDFHCGSRGEVADELSITLKFIKADKDAVVSKLAGYISDERVTYISYRALRQDLSYRLYIGHDLNQLEEINSRFYLKYLSLRYIKSQRDLDKYINLEKNIY
ncbi:AAA family ATPase [Pantoea dispersa]|uniref:AAA family ATPase n=1 Tax=Pantoea dispersa TaxID=59814 RepID=UPI001D0F7E4D|nr:ATP-binding protein [Pantoea dispersa]